MSKVTLLGLTMLVLGFSSMTSYADVVCKASMMGRVCYDSDGKELSYADLTEAQKAAANAGDKQKVAKK